MTTEELLKPRYKVIADYPNNVHKIESIITNHEGEPFDPIKHYSCSKYPHLFIPLHWSEKRNPEDLPKYIGCFEHDRVRWVAPIVKWVNTDNRNDSLECIISFTNLDGEYEEKSINQFTLTPATKEEYDSYIKEQNNKN